MAEITGGELKYVATIDISQLDKGLTDSTGKLKGFSEIAELSGEKLDNAFKGPSIKSIKQLAVEATKTGSALKSASDVKVDFGLTKENLIIQKQVIEEIKGNIGEIEKRVKDMAPGMAQSQLIGELGPLKQELAEEEKALLSLQEQLSATKAEQVSLTTEKNKALATMQRLTLENKKETDEYKTAEQAVIKYSDAIEKTNAKAKLLTSGGIAGIIQDLSVVTGLFATGQSLIGLFGSKNEELNEVMLKSQALLSATITLQQLQNSLKTEGGIISGIMAAQEIYRAKATALAGNATAIATIKQRIFNAVANANPYILLATAIITVVGAIGLYIAATNAASKAAKLNTELNNKVADSVAAPIIAYKTLQAQYKELTGDLKKREKFIKDNKDKFTELGVSVSNATEAENLFIKNEANFISSLMMRARAAAAAELAIEKYKTGLQAQLQDEQEKRDLKIKGVSLTRATTQLVRNSRLTPLAEQAQNDFNAANNLVRRNAEYEKSADDFRTKSGVKNVIEKEKKQNKTPKTKENTADEYFPPGSVAEIQKRISAIDEALSKATGQKSIDQLKQKRLATAIELLEAEKKIRQLSFQENAAEQEKYQQAFAVAADKYGQETATKMYAPLMEGSQSYFGFLDKEKERLEQIQQTGVLSDQQKEDLIFINQIQDELRGKKNAFETFTAGIDEALSKIPTLSGQIDFLKNKAEESLEIGGNKSFDNGEQKYLQQLQDDKVNQLRDNFQAFLVEQTTFEEKRLAIIKKYDELRSQATTPEEISKVEQAKASELLDNFFKQTEDNPAYAKMFTEMNLVATQELEKFRDILITKLNESKNEADKIKIGEFIQKIDETLLQRNPFKILSVSLKNLIENYRKLEEAQKSYNDSVVKFGANSAEAAKANDQLIIAGQNLEKSKKETGNSLEAGVKQALSYVSDARGIITDVKGAFDDLGLSLDNGFGDILEKADGYLEGMQQSLDGMMQVAQGLMTGNPVAIVAGVIKSIAGTIKSITSIFNNDRKKERDVQKNVQLLKQLEDSYNSLANAAEKAFGSQKYDGQRDLIKNLEEQKIIIAQMLEIEKSKKKKDNDKINSYQSQISAINQSIESIKEGIIKDVLQTDIVDAAAKFGDALVDGFGRGEDAIKSVEKAADDMLKNLLKNQLNLALQDKLKPILNNLLTAAGFNSDGTGNFTGLTPEQIADFKAQVGAAGSDMQSFLDNYSDIFGGLEENGDSLKGDIKGITEKTAGALEGQLNAIRIYQVEALNIQKANQQNFILSLQNLVLIEFNTRPLHRIDRNIDEMNSKMKKNLVGFP